MVRLDPILVVLAFNGSVFLVGGFLFDASLAVESERLVQYFKHETPRCSRMRGPSFPAYTRRSQGSQLQAFYSGCIAGRPTRPSVRSHFFHSPPTAEPSSLTHPHSPHAPPPPLPPTSHVLDICEMGEPSRKEQGQNPTGAGASNDSSSRRSSERTPPLKRRRIALACTVCRLRKSRVCEHLETPLRALNR